MKRKLLYTIFFILLFADLLPAIYGFLFKNIYYRQIESLQNQLQAQQQQNVKVEIASYDQGWFKSTAVLTMTINNSSQYHLPPLVFVINSTIHHGPLAYTDQGWKMVYANVATSAHLPEMLKILIPESPNGFFQSNSQLALNGTTWTTRFTMATIPASMIGQGGWDGASGDSVVETKNYKAVKIQNKIILNKFNLTTNGLALIDILLQPLEINLNATMDPIGLWNGTSNLNWSGTSSVKLSPSTKDVQGGNYSFFLTNLTMNNDFGVTNNLYDYLTNISIQNISLPTFTVSSFSNIKYSLAIKNLSAVEIAKLDKNMNANMMRGDNFISAFKQILTPSSLIQMNMATDTNLGSGSFSLTLTLPTIPTTEAELPMNISAIFNARISQALVNNVLANMVATNDERLIDPQSTENITPSAALVSSASVKVKSVLDELVKNGYIISNNNDYTLSITKQGMNFSLNGIKVPDVNALLANLNQILARISNPTQAAQTTNTQIFFGQDGRLTTNTGDWNVGSYKGECGMAQAVIGLSKYVNTTASHKLLCSPDVAATYPHNACYLRDFSHGDSRGATSVPDWDVGYYKGECGMNEYVTGVSQTTSGQVNGILCCPGTVTHAQCSTHMVDSSDWNQGAAMADWDYGYLKGQCTNGQYITGVSRTTDTGAPHGILCCSP